MFFSSTVLESIQDAFDRSSSVHFLAAPFRISSASILAERNVAIELLCRAETPLADHALACVLRSRESTEIRLAAMAALQYRAARAFGGHGDGHSAASDALFLCWPQLNDELIDTLAESPKGIIPALTHSLAQHANVESDTANNAIRHVIEIVGRLSLHRMMPVFVEIAESHHDRGVRSAAMSIVLQSAETLGGQARRGDGRCSERALLLKRLTLALHNHDLHQQDELVDAFLECCTWSDSPLRAVLPPEKQSGRRSNATRILLERLLKSDRPGVQQLMAGLLGIRGIASDVLQAIHECQADDLAGPMLGALRDGVTPTIQDSMRMRGLPLGLQPFRRLAETLDFDDAILVVQLAAATLHSLDDVRMTPLHPTGVEVLA
ncbi:MAG: hypothetical protein AAFP69_20770, partial [Planctomycetota bacterium]